jgi:hypothetical protein
LGPGALLLSVPIFLYSDKLSDNLLLGGIVVAGISTFFISFFLFDNFGIIAYNTVHYIVLTFFFLYFMKRPKRRLFISLLLTVTFTFVVIFAYETVTSSSLLQNTFDMLKNSGQSETKEFYKSLKPLLYITPGVLAISESAVLLINIYFFAKFTKTKTEFSNFKLPDFFLPVFLFTAITYMVATYIFKDIGFIHKLSLNMLLAITFFYFINGFAILVFGLNLAKTSYFLRIFVYVTAFMQPGLILVTALGFADFWVDIRQKMLKKHIK